MVWFITYRQFNSANEGIKPIRNEFVKMHGQSKKPILNVCSSEKIYFINNLHSVRLPQLN
jgi:hypothetical protein